MGQKKFKEENHKVFLQIKKIHSILRQTDVDIAGLRTWMNLYSIKNQKTNSEAGRCCFDAKFSDVDAKDKSVFNKSSVMKIQSNQENREAMHQQKKDKEKFDMLEVCGGKKKKVSISLHWCLPNKTEQTLTKAVFSTSIFAASIKSDHQKLPDFQEMPSRFEIDYKTSYNYFKTLQNKKYRECTYEICNRTQESRDFCSLPNDLTPANKDVCSEIISSKDVVKDFPSTFLANMESSGSNVKKLVYKFERNDTSKPETCHSFVQSFVQTLMKAQTKMLVLECCNELEEIEVMQHKKVIDRIHLSARCLFKVSKSQTNHHYSRNNLTHRFTKFNDPLAITNDKHVKESFSKNKLWEIVTTKLNCAVDCIQRRFPGKRDLLLKTLHITEEFNSCIQKHHTLTNFIFGSVAVLSVLLSFDNSSKANINELISFCEHYFTKVLLFSRSVSNTAVY
ncbi:uncharacterized protein LOC143446262 [Clavelina lepadiformis]|uniref:uncharacterized protein LOC143446262 n=1 Tax=Clavelina lepadiformis TaxID=159417 RepID=UPI004041FA16